MRWGKGWKILILWGVHWKIRFLRGEGGGFRQTNIYGGYCLNKGRAWTVSRFKEGGLCKKEGGGVFKGWGGDTLMHTMPGICFQYAS